MLAQSIAYWHQYDASGGRHSSGPLSDFPLDELVRRLGQGEVYVNLHTTAFPDGEIRGQMMRTL